MSNPFANDGPPKPAKPAKPAPANPFASSSATTSGGVKKNPFGEDSGPPARTTNPFGESPNPAPAKPSFSNPITPQISPSTTGNFNFSASQPAAMPTLEKSPSRNTGNPFGVDHAPPPVPKKPTSVAPPLPSSAPLSIPNPAEPDPFFSAPLAPGPTAPRPFVPAVPPPLPESLLPPATPPSYAAPSLVPPPVPRHTSHDFTDGSDFNASFQPSFGSQPQVQQQQQSFGSAVDSFAPSTSSNFDDFAPSSATSFGFPATANNNTAGFGVASSQGFDDFTASSASDPFFASTAAPPPVPASAAAPQSIGFDDFAPSQPQPKPQVARPAAAATDLDLFGGPLSPPAAPPAVPPSVPPAVPPPAPVPEPEDTFVGLPKLVPQSIDPIDDDFISTLVAHHPHHPPPAAAPAPAPAAVRRGSGGSAAAPSKPAAAAGGDPFAVLVKPLKPDTAHAPHPVRPVDPSAGMTLAQLSAAKNASVAPVLSKAAPPAPVALNQPSVAPAPRPVQDDSFDVFTRPSTATVAQATAAPLGWDVTPAAAAPAAAGGAGFSSFEEFEDDGFHPSAAAAAPPASSFGFPDEAPIDSWGSMPAAAPQHQQVDDFDVFVPKKTTAAPPSKTVVAPAAPAFTDDFDVFAAKKPASAAAPAPVADDFDVFNPKPSHPHIVAPVPAAVHMEDEFDIFSPKKNLSKPVSEPKGAQPSLQQHEYDIFSPKHPVQTGKTKAAPAAQSEEQYDEFDFDAPIVAPTGKSAGGKGKGGGVAAAPSQFLSSGDPFASNTADPFASPAGGAKGGKSSANSSHTTPFKASSAAPSSQSRNEPQQQAGSLENKEEVMEKFRKMYNIPNTPGGDEEDEEDEGSAGSDSEDDFDRKRHLKKSITGGSATSARSGSSASTVDEPKEGDILARLSTRSLVTKDWHDIYYRIENGFLYLYRNKLDYQYNPKGVNYKKKIAITHNLRLLRIGSKEYKGHGLVYNFMMEEVLDYGPSNVGKFGSTYKPTIELLYSQLMEVIKKKRYEKSHPPSQYK